MKYLHLSIFGGHKKRHGGTRRSEQIHELLASADGMSVNPYLPLKASLLVSAKNPLTFLKAFGFSAYLYLTRGLSFRGFLQYAVCSVNLIKEIERHKFDLVLHETAPGISIPFMRYLASRGIPYVALPHNIEYLVPYQVVKSFRANYRVYQNEIDGYRAARQVFAICEFDTAILRCTGVNAKTLEYRPTRSDREKLEGIRRNRLAAPKFENFLLLGTVENGPTYNGVKTLLDTLRRIRSPIKLTVAGYGTESFRAYESDTVKVLGSVSEFAVDKLLSQTRALLINQPQTTGFLTKIVEMNLCGVPQIIISDYFQADGLERFGIIRSRIEAVDTIEIPSSFEAFPEAGFEDQLTQFFPMTPTQ